MGVSKSKKADIDPAVLKILKGQLRGAKTMTDKLLAIPEAARDKWWRGMYAHWSERLEELTQTVEDYASGAIRAD